MTSGSPGGRHFRRQVSRLWIKIAAGLIIVAMVAVSVVTVAVLRLQGNLQTEPVELPPGTESGSDAPVPDPERDPLQVLIIGSDTRTGNEDYGSEAASSGGGQADVMMLLHLSADRERATALSFPRDLMVPIPACEIADTGRTIPAMEIGQLNGTLRAGPACTAAAINELTGLRVDHLMVADFNAVTELTETIGGVEVCLSEEVDDPKSGLDLPAGVSQIQGEQTLAFLRTRAAFADGSDTGRIQAQQSFLASLARKIKDEGTLRNVPKLYSIAETITSNLTVDEDLSDIPALLRFADRLRSIEVADIDFITVPNQPWAQNPNRLELIEAPAGSIFEALAHDRPIGEDPQTPQPAPTPTQPASAPGSQQTSALSGYEKSIIAVDIINRSGQDGRGADVRRIVAEAGYDKATTGAPGQELPSTQVLYGYGGAAAAEAVASTLGVQPAQIRYSAHATGITVLIGADFTTGDSVDASEGLPGELQGQTADQVTCQAVR